jgi:phosphoribosylamine--glycine ligase
MKILLIDQMGSFLDFALRCEAQGHEVRVWIAPDKRTGEDTQIGKGLITRIPDWRSSMRWADFIATSDNVKHIRELESYRNRGFPIWGCNVECAAWELERGTGQRVLEAAGIATIPSITFSNYNEAIAYQIANPHKRYVSKPTGDADKALSYVSKSGRDMLFMLDYWQATQKKKVPFLFQEFIPGIEVAVGGWMGRNGFSQYFLENFEFKKLMNDEKGVNTGEMGTAMKYVTAAESKLARDLLLPIEAELIRSGYTGYIDVSAMVGKKDGIPGPMEITSRMGWPLFQIQQALHPDVVDWMKDSMEGRDTFEPCLDVAVGVLVAIPDFPYGHATRKSVSGFPIWGISKKNRYNLHPCEMMLGEAWELEGSQYVKRPAMVSSGDYLVICSGTHPRVSKAIETAYSNVSDLEIPNSPIYRTDIGRRIEHQLKPLQAHGYMTAWEW